VVGHVEGGETRVDVGAHAPRGGVEVHAAVIALHVGDLPQAR
jgi:hypothetical protein